jgi:hypothetical protein
MGLKRMSVYPEVLELLREIRDVVLDLQTRQKEMDARQQVIKKDVEASPVMQTTSLYQKE